MYLHDYGNEDDTFNKEEIILKNGLPIPYNVGKFEEYYPTKTNVEKHVWNYYNSSQKEEDYEQEEEEEEEEEEETEESEEEEEEEEEEEPLKSPKNQEKKQIFTSPIQQKIDPKTINQNVKKSESVLPSTAMWGQTNNVKKNTSPPQTQSVLQKKETQMITKTKQVTPLSPTTIQQPSQINAWGIKNTVQQSTIIQQNDTKPVEKKKEIEKIQEQDNEYIKETDIIKDIDFSFNSLQVGTKTIVNPFELFIDPKRKQSRFQFAQSDNNTKNQDYFEPFKSSVFEDLGFGNIKTNNNQNTSLQDSLRSLLPHVNINFQDTTNTQQNWSFTEQNSNSWNQSKLLMKEKSEKTNRSLFKEETILK